MRFSTAASLALANLVAASPFAEQIQSRQTDCGTIHLMLAGGCDLPCPVDQLGYLDTTVGNITAAFPGATQYLVPYTNDTQQARESTPVMVAAFNEFIAQCPNTPVVFVGYSLGGIILMNTLCGGLSSDDTSHVIAAIAYGEETYTYPATYDKGTCTNQAPQYPRANAAEACAAYAPVIQNYCSSGDPACCNGGTDLAQHFSYPTLYDVQITNYIKSQYAAYEAKFSSSSSSSSVASSTAAPSTTSSVSSSASVTTSTTAISSPHSAVNSVTSSPASSTSTAPVTTSTSMTSSSSTSTSQSTYVSSTPATSSATTMESTSAAATKTLPAQTTYSVVPYTGAANKFLSGTYVQAFVAVAIYGLL